MRFATSSFGVAFCTALVLSAVEPATPVTEMDLERAQLCAGEGDFQNALLLGLHILRKGPQEDLRESARQMLRDWGLVPQELLALDPTTLKPAELNALCDRVAQAQRARHRQGLEMTYCNELLESAVLIRRGGDGRFSTTFSDADLGRALNGLIQIAITQPATEHSEQALRRLEELGCVGARLEAIRKTIVEGTLPETVKNEVVASICLQRLRQYQQWIEAEGDEPDVQMRKELGRQLGLELFRFCEKELKATAAIQRDQDAMNFWRVPPTIPPNF